MIVQDFMHDAKMTTVSRNLLRVSRPLWFYIQNYGQLQTSTLRINARAPLVLDHTFAKWYTSENGTKPESAAQTKEAIAEDSPVDSNDELAKLQSQVEKYTQQANEYKDSYQRALAEAQNVRMRMTKQVQDARQFGISGFCKDLLTVADTLKLASDNIPAEQTENPSVKSMLEGLRLTESQLLKVFTDHGVTVLNPEGEKFDPNFHEALFEQPIPGKDPGVIFVVTKVGYKLHDRVLRPAMVGVVKAP